jgi:hypothetical protein
MKTSARIWLFRAYLTVTLLFLAIGSASAVVSQVICVPWQGDVNKQHTAISGSPVQLQGVIKTTDTTPVYYQWSYGDGTTSAITTLSGSTKYNVAAPYTYTAANETPFTATLQVSNTNSISNPFAVVMSSNFLVKIEASSQNALINIAIDNGLWWLYNQANKGSYYNAGYLPQAYDGSPVMVWEQDNYVVTYTAPTAAAVQAFGINGHQIKGNPALDPYVEAVQDGMNYLVKGYFYWTTNPALTALAIAPESTHPADNPDSNNNGYGVQVYDYEASHIPYQTGGVMDAIIASGVAPGDLTGRDFTQQSSTINHNWTYGELLQDMADMYAWGQYDGANCDGGLCGSWWYGWNYGFPGDNSASQWGAIGMIPAQQSPWNVVVPQWVKTYNQNWVNYSFCPTDAGPVHAFFSYNSPCGCAGDSCLQTTAAAMVEMAFNGQTTADPKWAPAQQYLTDDWYGFLYNGSSWGGNSTYGWYGFAKAMRLAQPTAITTIQKTGDATPFDWYYGDLTASCTSQSDCRKGLAQRIIEAQSADGSWQNGNLSNPPLTTAWMINILNPTLFAAAPIACFTASPNPGFANQNVIFNPSCSGDSAPGKTIANLTKFEWSWTNDGVYEVSSATPSLQQHPFACPGLSLVPPVPCTYPVTLRVSDDNTPPLTATTIVNVNITNPPHPPVANAGGPYLTSTCSNDSVQLNGSQSYDPDQGLSETNCPTCAAGALIAWNWDLIPPLTFTGTPNATGVTPLLTSANIANDFFIGTQSIGLQVVNNTATAFPDSGVGNQTNAAFTSVSVVPGCICNLVAAPKSGVVQLSWTGLTGNQTYDIARSTTGPNSGFTTIASGYSTPNQAYQDRTVTNGTTYYYRVTVHGSTACMSAAAQAKPVATVR